MKFDLCHNQVWHSDIYLVGVYSIWSYDRVIYENNKKYFSWSDLMLTFRYPSKLRPQTACQSWVELDFMFWNNGDKSFKRTVSQNINVAKLSNVKSNISVFFCDCQREYIFCGQTLLIDWTFQRVIHNLDYSIN